VKRYAALLLVIAIVGASGAAAQQSSPVADLLAGARNALNDLEYRRADSIARSRLALGAQLSGADRSQTYQLLAAAAYPEEQAAQRPVSAEQYLRRLLQLDPTATMSRDITWPGLDSLLEDTRRSTFAVSVVPLVDTVRAGRETTHLFQVRATRPASLTLAADNEGGSVVELDREGPVDQAVLGIEAIDGDRAILRSGSYTFWITARDPILQEEVKFAFDVRVQAPRLELAHVPVAIDSSLFLPEQAVPRRTRNALIGIALGATTALAATTFVGSDELSGVSSSGQAYAVGGIMTLGALVGTFLEKPRPIPENIVHNEQVRADFAEAVRSASATNAARRRDYRVTIVIVGEMR
jgi:hypothetical protein